ncbi:MAG: type II toxin-antitoxin system RelE/ParE family toxin [Mycobacteriales bacterium]
MGGAQSWEVAFHQQAHSEYSDLSDRERKALNSAVAKLVAFGPALPYPHSSAVVAAAGLRELRPRRGRSRWRAFYQRVGDVMVIAAVGPEAQVNQRGFAKAVAAAKIRLAELEANS